MLDWGIGWKESVPHKEDKVHERPESDCSAVDGALGVSERSEEEVEAQCDQMGNLTGFGLY